MHGGTEEKLQSSSAVQRLGGLEG